MAQYKAVSRGDMELFLGMQLAAKIVDLGPRCKEIVFERDITTASGVEHPFKLRIYTSIDQRDNECRDKGKDAIRVLLVSKKDGKVVRKSTRINRVGDEVMKRVMDRCRELFRYAIDPTNKCSKCDDGVLVLRKPKRGQTWTEFKGCSNYPVCKGSARA